MDILYMTTKIKGDDYLRRVITKNLTPKMAWNQLVSTSEEIFISNYRADRPPITDIKKMCKVYAEELPIIFEYEKILFSDKQLKEIEKLLTEHLESYIIDKGGIDKLELLTEAELDAMALQDHEIIMEGLANRLGTTREKLSEAMKKNK